MASKHADRLIPWCAEAQTTVTNGEGTPKRHVYDVGRDPSGILLDGVNIWVTDADDNAATKLAD